MTMGQRIAVMNDGVLQQCDRPETVYTRPANKFVAGFIGSPPMNFLDAKVIRNGKLMVDAGELKFPLPDSHPAKALTGKQVTVGIRPEAIFDSECASSVQKTPDNSFKAQVDVLEPLGHEYVAYLSVGGHNIVATIDTATRIKEGQTAEFLVKLDELHVFDNDTEAAVR